MYFANLHLNEDISCSFIVLTGYKGLYSLSFILFWGPYSIDAKLDSRQRWYNYIPTWLGSFGWWLAFLFSILLWNQLNPSYSAQ